jgi:hypothetical protein
MTLRKYKNSVRYRKNTKTRNKKSIRKNTQTRNKKRKERNLAKRTRKDGGMFGVSNFPSLFKQTEQQIAAKQQLENERIKNILNPKDEREKQKSIKSSVTNAIFSPSNVAAVSGVGAGILVTRIALATVIGVGMASPAMPAVAVLLLVMHKIANIYKSHINMRGLITDSLNILCNMYKLNRLIDKTVQVFYVYIFNNADFIKAAPLPEKAPLPDSDKPNNSIIEPLVPIKPDGLKLEEISIKVEDENLNMQEMFKKAQENVNEILTKKTDAEMKNCIAPEDVLKLNNIDVKDNNKTILLGKLIKNKSIDDRLYDKVTSLTQMLIQLLPTSVIEEMLENHSIKDNQFGDLLKIEYGSRIGDVNNSISYKRVFRATDYVFSGLARSFMRTVKAKEKTDLISQNLTVMNSYFALMKSQYDFQNDYYSRTLLPEENRRIWQYIQTQEEYISYMVPVDEMKDSLTIFNNEVRNLKFLPKDYSDAKPIPKEGEDIIVQQGATGDTPPQSNSNPNPIPTPIQPNPNTTQPQYNLTPIQPNPNLKTQ